MLRNIIKYNNLIWLLMLLAGGSHILKSQSLDTVYIQSSYKVDLCDIKSEDNPHQGKVQLVLDIGEVSVNDSLFGYDFQLKYDSEQIALNAPLFFNTLTEYMEERDISFMQDTGLAVGYGLSMSIYQPVYGNRKLVAMRGDYLKNCPDTSDVTISYIEFTDEFTRDIKGFSNAKVISYIDYSEDRYFKLVPSGTMSNGKDIEIDSIGYDMFALDVSTISEHNVTDFIVTFEKPNGNFYIDSIMVYSEKVALNSKDETDEKIICNFTAFENLTEENLFEVLVRNYENTDAEELLNINVEVLDNCTCLTNVQGTEITLKSNYAEESTDVVDYDDSFHYNYNQYNEILTIESENIFINRINVFNIQGQMIDSYHFNDKNLSVTTKDMPNGIYVYQIITDNNKIKNIFIIK